MTDRQHLRDDPLGLRKPKEVKGEGPMPDYDVIDVEVLDATAAKARDEVPARAFPAKLSVVCRAACSVEVTEEGEFELDLGSGRVPVAAFTDRGRADLHAAELTRRARAELSPLLVMRPNCILNYTSNRGEGEWVRRFAELGLALPKEHPPKGRVDRYDWDGWAATSPLLSEEQRAAIWELCDREPLYEVVEVPTRE
jgi:hypothetical protein